MIWYCFSQLADDVSTDHKLLKDYQSLRYTPAIIDQYTEEQIDALRGETGKGTEIKRMVEKIRTMNQAIEGLEV